MFFKGLRVKNLSRNAWRCYCYVLLYSFVCFTCIGGKVCVYMGGRQQGQKEAPVPALAPSPALLTPQGWGRQGQGHLLMCWGQAHVTPAVTAAHRGSPSGSVLLWVCLISVQLPQSLVPHREVV